MAALLLGSLTGQAPRISASPSGPHSGGRCTATDPARMGVMLVGYHYFESNSKSYCEYTFCAWLHIFTFDYKMLPSGQKYMKIC